jgi:single-stranded DNA-binding protein
MLKQNAVKLTITLGADAEVISKDGAQIGLRMRGAYSTERGSTGWINTTWWTKDANADDYPKGTRVTVDGTLGFDTWKGPNDENRQQVTLVVDKIE